MQFRLGTFSHRGSVLYPGLVLDERVYALTRLGSLLSGWDRNFAALTAIAAALRDGKSGAHLDSGESVNVHALYVHAPIHLPRQLSCAIGNDRSHILDSVRDPTASPRLGEPDTAECVQRAARTIEERLRSAPCVCVKLPSTATGPDALCTARRVMRHLHTLSRLPLPLESASRICKRCYAKCARRFAAGPRLRARNRSFSQALRLHWHGAIRWRFATYCCFVVALQPAGRRRANDCCTTVDAWPV
jgi:hypothetical protein